MLAKRPRVGSSFLSRSLVVGGLNFGNETSDSLLLGSSGGLLCSKPLAALAVLKNKVGLLCDDLANGLGISGLLFVDWIGSDSAVCLGVKFLKVLCL